MNALQQMWAIALMNMRNLHHRMGVALIVVIGTCAAVTVLVSVFAMLMTFENALRATAKLNRAIVMTKDSYNEFGSGISRSAVAVIADSPGIKRGMDGKPLYSAEVVVGVHPRRRDGRPGYSLIRGISLGSYGVRPEVKLIAGGMYHPAVREVIVSARARRQYEGLDVGGRVSLGGISWDIVGEFEGDGFHDNEFIADPETVMSAYHQNAFQSVTVMLESTASLAALKTTLTDNPQAQVDASTEADYEQKVSGFFLIQLWFVVFGVGGVLGLGTIFAVLNAMYSSTAARTLEIATLRAIGFNGPAVVASVFAEAWLLALIGGAFGALFAYASVDHALIEAGPTFLIRVTPLIMAAGLGSALAIGAIGALFPAIRAARLPIATALQVR